MSNRNSTPASIFSVKTTLSSERPLSFSECDKSRDVDFTMSKNFDDLKDQQLLSTSSIATIAKTQQHHDNNSNHSNNGNKLKLISKTKNLSSTNNPSITSNITLTTPPSIASNKSSKLLKIKSKSSSSTNSSNTTPTPPNTGSISGVFVVSANKSLSQDEDNDNPEEADNKDTSSLASHDNSKATKKLKRQRKGAQKSSAAMSNSRDWEILEGLKLGQSFTHVPEKFEGFMMKNRKWPMKGWHKRFFSLKNGYLIYAKSQNDIERGKHHGQVDVGLSVIVCKERGFRIDMDADDTIYHLKTKTQSEFDDWKNHLKNHRLFRQNAISTGCDNHLGYEDEVVATATTSAVAAMTTAVKQSSIDYQYTSRPTLNQNNNSPFLLEITDGDSVIDGVHMRKIDSETSSTTATAAAATTPSSSTVVVGDSSIMDKKMVLLTSDELNEVQLKLCDLGMLLGDIQQCHEAVNNAVAADANVAMKKKPKRHLRMRKDKRQKELLVPELSPALVKCSSNPSLAINEEILNGPILDFHQSSTAPVFNQLANQQQASSNNGGLNYFQSQFYKQAEFVLSKLDKINNQMMTAERSRNNISYSSTYVQSLKFMMAELKKQNSEMKSRLNRIHSESSVPEANLSIHPSLAPTPTFVQPQEKTPSVDSSDSLDSQNNQFYDAPDQLEHSSEGSEEDEEEDDASDSENKANEEQPNMEERFSRFQMRRRSRLPSPSVSNDISIWGLLRKNIGKDLSKISMPVVMNEPLNALQRLCEELEYSELLERAVDVEDPYERMVWVAVFTVSTYANTFTRAARKPFNPLLGETFEIDRSEKGWRFIAEQVSHHPPVSASYCESKDFVMWQDMQVKTKFWGKSMEVQPIGIAHLLLNKHKEEYTWNKATSCIHNILGGQRWVEHYGEVVVTNHTRGIICKLNYVKSSYFSAKKYEVYGQVYGSDGGPALHHLFGRWNESMFHGQSESTAKCIWRPGALPPDHHLYYGFTKLAMELNEIDVEQAANYPRTDTRYRPDQRLLELGRVEEAEMEKRMVEQRQRDMRNDGEFDEALYQPLWFTRRAEEDDKDSYTYNGQYWNKRKNPGFANMDLPLMW